MNKSMAPDQDFTGLLNEIQEYVTDQLTENNIDQHKAEVVFSLEVFIAKLKTFRYSEDDRTRIRLIQFLEQAKEGLLKEGVIRAKQCILDLVDFNWIATKDMRILIGYNFQWGF